MLHDKGIQATIGTAAILAILTSVAYSPALLAVWAAWAGIGAWATYEARRRHAR